jgi:hypothetical protein
MSALRRGWDWLAISPHQLKGLRALQACLGAMLLFRMSTEARFAPFLWGPRGIGHGTMVPLYGAFGSVLDIAYSSAAAVTGFAVIGAVAGACLVLGRWTRIASLIAFLVIQTFETRLPELCDGGDNVARLVLGYMIFCLPRGARPKPGSLRVWLHNVASLAIGAQLCVLYFTSGFMKLSGERWTHGVATYLISQVEWFSLPSAREIFKNAFVAMTSSYGSMLFQFWFPVAIFTRAKLIWLAVGIFFHLNIAVLMGLVSFSLAMIGLELFVVTDEEWGRLARAARQLASRLPRLSLSLEEP